MQDLVIRPRWITLSAIIVALVLALSVSTGLAWQKTTSPPGFGGRSFGNNGQQACRQNGQNSVAFGGSIPADPLNAVAGALNIDPATLQRELAAGTSLSQIISQHGMTGAQVVQAIVAQGKMQLDQQVAGGRLTATQESATLAATTASINAAIAGQTPLTGSVSRQGAFAHGTASGQSGQAPSNRQGLNGCGG